MDPTRFMHARAAGVMELGAKATAEKQRYRAIAGSARYTTKEILHEQY